MDRGMIVNMVSFWRVYQMKIIHPINFQNVHLYLIYLNFKFTLKSMGNPRLIKIYLKEITFPCKSLGRKLHKHSFYKKNQIELIINRMIFFFSKIIFFLIFTKGR
jgi:hypothetical protein